MTNTKLNIEKILEINENNHNFLIKNLKSNKGDRLVGKWVAVAKNKIFSSSNYEDVIEKIKKIETNREKILILKVPKNNTFNISF
jgi:hypothetical protein